MNIQCIFNIYVYIIHNKPLATGEGVGVGGLGQLQEFNSRINLMGKLLVSVMEVVKALVLDLMMAMDKAFSLDDVVEIITCSPWSAPSQVLLVQSDISLFQIYSNSSVLRLYCFYASEMQSLMDVAP